MLIVTKMMMKIAIAAMVITRATADIVNVVVGFPIV